MLMNGNSTGNRMDTHSNDASNESPNCDALLNLTILDPAKYGWSVLGGIRNVCPPHEVRCYCTLNDEFAMTCYFIIFDS
jgi:hypothetical protein